MQVGPALLIEYTAPAAVVVWLWLRHGQRPGPADPGSAPALAALGLVLVLDLLSGADRCERRRRSGRWVAMVGCGDATSSSPPTTTTDCRRLVLAGPACSSARSRLGVLGAGGRAADARPRPTPTTYAGVDVRRGGCRWSCSAWSPRRSPTSPASPPVAGSGSRLASFVALLEVVAGVVLGVAAARRAPGRHPVLGGLLILAGVVAVKLGERLGHDERTDARLRRCAAAHAGPPSWLQST